jgi:hypothetical protein
MKIDHIDGSNTSTENLSDFDAEILQKTEQLRDLCFKYKRQLFISVDAKNNMKGDYFAFWNLGTSELDSIQSPEDHAKLVNPLLLSINKVVQLFTYGQASIQQNKHE